jgi:hypothetical protein
MKPRTRFGRYSILILLIAMLASCQTATPPPPLSVTTDAEFTLAPGQSAALIDAIFTVRLIGISGDDRCPSDVECAASGPVSVSFTLQKSNGPLTTVDLQTFTDTSGRAPDIQFEGIQDRTIYEGYLIRIVSVLPYPKNSDETITESDYRVTFLATEE